MTGNTRVSIKPTSAILVGLLLVAIGAAASYFITRGANSPSDVTASSIVQTAKDAGSAPRPAPSAAQPDAPLPDVVVPLSAEAIARAGLVVTPASSGKSGADIRLPGVVEPNAYKQVAVTPLVSGRVTRVSAALGDRVRGGQTIAQIYSPELADAQTKYVSAKAMLDAHDRELQRTEKLVQIGAASRQELERIHADHAAQLASVQSSRSELELLGVSSSTIEGLGAAGSVNATVNVAAPIDGVVTERAVNIGLNVDPATNLFTVVDLSTVWIVADLYEKDFSRVRDGSNVTVTTTAYPDLSLRGSVSYIDPQVNTESRTAKIRIEVPNPRAELRLGMFVDVVVATAGVAKTLVVPRSAIQNVGDRTVVYLANTKESGKFTEREVRLGQSAGEQVEIVSGVAQGDTVVTEGSFFVRAERERLGLRATSKTPTASKGNSSATETAPVAQQAKIIITEQSFEPSKVAFRAGVPARLTFVRTTDKTCATEVAFPSLNIRRALPLNELVQIDFTPAKPGEIGFSCGMNMLRGTITIQ
jgi:RND family efflux transporter MFP subunit